jgi:K+-sensing histidine kinase KdpD
MTPIATSVLVAVALLLGLWLALKRKPSTLTGRRAAFCRKFLRAPNDSSGPTLQSVCEAAAEQLKGVVVVVERSNGDVRAVAGSARDIKFGPLDKLAICGVFDDGEPAGLGSGRFGMSDWLFAPVKVGNEVLGVAGIAGRYCRRRFEPNNEPVLDGLTRALATVMRSPFSVQSEPTSCHRKVPLTA